MRIWNPGRLDAYSEFHSKFCSVMVGKFSSSCILMSIDSQLPGKEKLGNDPNMHKPGFLDMFA